MDENTDICIIEDEAIIAYDIQATLQDLGYSVSKILHHSDKAIDYLSFHSPDLVLCDINIKGPNDGIEVARKIRSKKAIPFVFLTSLSDRHTITRAREALPYGYIVKPFDQKDLLSTIEIALYKYKEEVQKMHVTKDKIDSLWDTSFTDKEYEIISEMLRGKSYADIERDSCISHNTLKYHTKNIFSKSHVANKAEFMQLLLAHFLTV